jgi:diguanylate cyclase (GGDEF)-like protein
LFIDLDHFKAVNDTYGHLIGSKLLAEIGYLIKAQLRLIDFAFRYGGDEFVVLLPQTGKDQALVVARRLRDGLRASVFCKEEGLNLNVRASIGLSTFPHDARTAHDVIRQADGIISEWRSGGCWKSSCVGVLLTSLKPAGLLSFRFTGFSCRLDLWLPRVHIGGGFGIDAEIPDIEVHSFFSHHFYDGVFSRD